MIQKPLTHLAATTEPDLFPLSLYLLSSTNVKWNKFFKKAYLIKI